MKIGKAIVALRTAKNISQNQFAKASGFDRSYVYKLENDLISPSLDTLEKAAHALGVKISTLILEAEQLPRESEGA